MKTDSPYLKPPYSSLSSFCVAFPKVSNAYLTSKIHIAIFFSGVIWHIEENLIKGTGTGKKHPLAKQQHGITWFSAMRSDAGRTFKAGNQNETIQGQKIL